MERNDQMRLGQSANIVALEYEVSLAAKSESETSLCFADIGVVLTQHRVGDKIIRFLSSRAGKRCFCIRSIHELQGHSLQLMVPANSPLCKVVQTALHATNSKFSKKHLEGESLRR